MIRHFFGLSGSTKCAEIWRLMVNALEEMSTARSMGHQPAVLECNVVGAYQLTTTQGICFIVPHARNMLDRNIQVVNALKSEESC